MSRPLVWCVNLLPNDGIGQTPPPGAAPVASAGVIHRLPRALTTGVAGVVTGLLVAIVPALDAYAHVARALGIAGVALGAAGLAMGLSARQARRRDA